MGARLRQPVVHGHSELLRQGRESPRDHIYSNLTDSSLSYLYLTAFGILKIPCPRILAAALRAVVLLVNVLVHLPDMLLNGEFGITEVPNYRAFYATYTELKIDAEMVPKLRLTFRTMILNEFLNLVI